MMKKTRLLATTISLLTAAGLANAADNNTNNPAPSDAGVVSAIQQLGNRIESLTKAQVNWINEKAFKLEQSTLLAMQLNIKQSEIQTETQTKTQLESDRAVKRALKPFSAATLTYTTKSQPAVQLVSEEETARQNYIKQLKDVDASDSIYSLVQGMEISSYWSKKNLTAPGRNDDALNFAALIEPEAYTQEQAKNTTNFIGYATKQYQTYDAGLDLRTLRDAFQKYQKQGVKTLSQQIDAFRNNKDYKDYQLTIRSMTATTSVSTDILNGLAQERKPITKTEADPQLEAISRLIGVEPQVVSEKNDKGESITLYRYASPYQIAKYRATYRLSSPQWYQEVAGDSAENLQRKQVILLSEISSQLFELQKQHEKMLGVLAIMNLQSNEGASMLLKSKVNDVNTAIASFAADAGTSTAQQQQAASDSSGATTNTDSAGNSPTSYSTNPDDYKNVDPNSYTAPAQ